VPLEAPAYELSFAVALQPELLATMSAKSDNQAPNLDSFVTSLLVIVLVSVMRICRPRDGFMQSRSARRSEQLPMTSSVQRAMTCGYADRSSSGRADFFGSLEDYCS